MKLQRWTVEIFLIPISKICLCLYLTPDVSQTDVGYMLQPTPKKKNRTNQNMRWGDAEYGGRRSAVSTTVNHTPHKCKNITPSAVRRTLLWFWPTTCFFCLAAFSTTWQRCRQMMRADDVSLLVKFMHRRALTLQTCTGFSRLKKNWCHTDTG